MVADFDGRKAGVLGRLDPVAVGAEEEDAVGVRRKPRFGTRIKHARANVVSESRERLEVKSVSGRE